MALIYVCETCRGTNVHRDAWADWDPKTQAWELGDATFDYAICDDCDGETHLDEAEGEACANCGDYAETLHESPDELYSMTDPVTGAVTLGRICKACLEAGEG